VAEEHNIILTGFMGTGKSAVGKRLAARLGRPFFDTDALIEEEAHTSIAHLFAEQGELYFRALETQVIERVCTRQRAVIATGGGSIVNADNARRMKACGMVICLTATAEVILERVQDNTDRPLLQGGDPLGKMRALLTSRAEAYARADVRIDTSRLSVDEVVETICQTLDKRRAGHA
jgi:shikimate kinase